MTWGTGPWGTSSPWGTGVALPPPSIISVTSDPGDTAPKSNPAVIARRGGTICTLLGTNFFDPTIVEVLIGGAGAYTKVAEGYIFDAEFDLKRSKLFFGAPALVDGLYHVRIVTEGGQSNVLESVLEARLFAEEYKTVSVRAKYAPVWKTGERYLREG